MTTPFALPLKLMRQHADQQLDLHLPLRPRAVANAVRFVGFTGVESMDATNMASFSKAAAWDIASSSAHGTISTQTWSPTDSSLQLSIKEFNSLDENINIWIYSLL